VEIADPGNEPGRTPRRFTQQESRQAAEDDVMIDAGTALELLTSCTADSQRETHRYPRVTAHPDRPVRSSLVGRALEMTDLPPVTIRLLSGNSVPDGLTLGAFVVLAAGRRCELAGGSPLDVVDSAVKALDRYLDLVPFDALSS
jgi:hypothetical protein